MRKIIEHTLASIDGVATGPQLRRFFEYRDDAYYRDGLGELLGCEAMLMGRTTFEEFAKIWPGRSHPWADRLNNIKKYVFSSTLEKADWDNSVIVRGDVATEAAKLKAQDGGDLLIYGHGLLARTLLKAGLVDFFGGLISTVCGRYMREYGTARAFLDSRVQTIYGGTTGIMKEIIGRSLGSSRLLRRNLDYPDFFE
jgi:dihydrofolate reductase